MTTRARREKLLEYLRRGHWYGYVLAMGLGVSQRTIRRDIAVLRDKYKIRSGSDGYWIRQEDNK